MSQIIDVFLHLDRHLNELVGEYGGWTHVILFLIIFCETGLVVTPFLPGDSLLFAVGALAATPGSPIAVTPTCFLLIVAAILGDATNYWIGHYVSGHVVHWENSRWLKKEYLDRTHQFYERYGGKTIIFARFVPIVRTFAPFVAGVGSMTYGKFFMFNVVGGIVWVLLFVLGGYFFGNIPAVKHNFTLVILGIIAVSILPAIIEILRHRRTRA